MSIGEWVSIWSIKQCRGISVNNSLIFAGLDELVLVNRIRRLDAEDHAEVSYISTSFFFNCFEIK